LFAVNLCAYFNSSPEETEVVAPSGKNNVFVISKEKESEHAPQSLRILYNFASPLKAICTAILLVLLLHPPRISNGRHINFTSLSLFEG